MNNFQVKENKEQISGLFSTKNYKSSELIHSVTGEVHKEPSKYTIEIEGQHIFDKNIIYMNHSCMPNTKVVKEKIFAITEINTGDELCFDYHTTESLITSPFVCNDCGKMIE